MTKKLNWCDQRLDLQFINQNLENCLYLSTLYMSLFNEYYQKDLTTIIKISLYFSEHGS